MMSVEDAFGWLAYLDFDRVVDLLARLIVKGVGKDGGRTFT